jgi:hypothetical protein
MEMARTLRTLLGGVVFLLAFALMNRIGHAFGAPVVALIGLASGFGVWIAHTERSAIFAEMFRRALSDAGIVMKEAAAVMGCGYSVLSEGLNGSEQLSLSRAASLPDDFWVSFAKRVLSECAHERLQIVEKPVAELVRAVEHQNELLAALVNPKPRMAKMANVAAVSEVA